MIGRLANAANHHPDIDLRHEGVTVRLATHDADGLSERDVELARKISGAAREMGVLADPTAVQTVQIAMTFLSVPRCPQRNRIHLDISVPHDQAEARIAAAIAAGGHLVSDEHAPAWWTPGRRRGQRADVATWMGRD